MQIERAGGDEIVLRLGRDELSVLNNALNLVCNGIDLGCEFETLIGSDLASARRLLDAIVAALDQPTPD
ncbi:MAG: hypothetical protein GC191_07055 [Azospirillum sp.]|nr:hypothetical protein [Azospirillum sp.]